ncbi:MAG TPA: IS982 family transposase [Ktedonobacterales bacterium]|nr:IS982 family transposase [Ktedonobacterales bacterium]
MDLDDFIIAVFCVVDEAVLRVLEGRRLRQRGPAPTLADSEVLTMEVVGEYLGLEQDSALFAYFRRHYAHFFPALRTLHRTTFVRQATNLWWLKEQLWQRVLDWIPHDPAFAILDSLPLPVCQFARAYRCRRFRGTAAFGKDTLVRQTFYGLRVHVRLEWPGVITRFGVAPANAHELTALPALAEQTSGILIGDRNYWSPATMAEWQRRGVELLAPYRSAKRDPHPRWSTVLSRVRYRIDTVFGQLVSRCDVKRVWARDLWHLSNRLLRKVLMHTVAVLLNVERGNPPLHLAQVVA